MRLSFSSCSFTSTYSVWCTMFSSALCSAGTMGGPRRAVADEGEAVVGAKVDHRLVSDHAGAPTRSAPPVHRVGLDFTSQTQCDLGGLAVDAAGCAVHEREGAALLARSSQDGSKLVVAAPVPRASDEDAHVTPRARRTTGRHPGAGIGPSSY